VPELNVDEAVVFEDLFVAGLRLPPHPALADIMQLSKFFWAVTSCGGRPTAEVFAKYYELHYQ
jgi:hypothetical protein